MDEEARLAAIFTEWQRRYEESPGEFGGIEGSDYGAKCAKYFMQLDRELPQ